MKSTMSQNVVYFAVSLIIMAVWVSPVKATEAVLELEAPPAYSDRFAAIANLGLPSFPQQDTVYGWQFMALKDFTITDLGWWVGNGGDSTVPHQVGIFDLLSRALLVSTFVNPGDPVDGEFQFAAIEPFTVEAGREYIIAGHTPPGVDQWAGSSSVVVGPDIQFGGGRREFSTFGFPTDGTSTFVAFGANFKYKGETITTIDDAAGKARLIGGEVRLGGNLIGYFNWQSRELPARGADLLDSETVTITIALSGGGGGAPRNFTLHGIFQRPNERGKGGVSAISSGVPDALKDGKWTWTGPRDDGELTIDF